MTTYRSALLPRGSTRAWRRLRAAVLKSVNYRCSVCGVKQLAGLQVHHRIKRELGGDDSYGGRNGNLVVSCQRCHEAMEAELA